MNKRGIILIFYAVRNNSIERRKKNVFIDLEKKHCEQHVLLNCISKKKNKIFINKYDLFNNYNNILVSIIYSLKKTY